MCNGWHIRLNNKAYKKAEKSSVLIQLSGWLRTLDMWEDYKIDFFAFFGVVFVPLRKILNFQG